MIDWAAFLVVAAAALVSSAVVVSLYSLGLRLLTTAGRIPTVEPAEFTGAITVLSPARAAKDAKRARKALKANPLTDIQKSVAQYGGYLCFALCGLIVLYGVYLIVPALHQ
ncbi:MULTISPECIES: peptidase [Cryobacterium]|uniref:Peptidase n=1 Tax=Cryobacterium zongtaii TaxID=1259217 RepID=A0A2S3ZKI7_9MICO|nr:MULTISPECIES: peptidase [Cryobacterium]POH63148.1 peptidase [Cryobacterium zongtaii]POH68867.1 peptidase [Cryobacterium zongtaii]TFC43731.1 peptidase [Cryobacterium sp. TMN-39-2]